MKKADVKVGGKYYANVSGKRVQVRLDALRERGGWDATNLTTNKKIVIKSAQRLHGEVGETRKAETIDAASPAKPVKAETIDAASPAKPVKAKATTPAKGTPQAKSPKAGKPVDGKKLSAIDAAAKVLGDAGQPMNCKELIETMTAKGLWSSPGGKTPWATLYSAILREINLKGAEARFAKTERGKFAANA